MLLHVNSGHAPPSPLCAVLGLTVSALVRGLAAMMSGDRKESQRMMRHRVGFQLVTVLMVSAGVYWNAYRQALVPATSNEEGSSSGAAAGDSGDASVIVDKRVYLTDSRMEREAARLDAALAAGRAAAKSGEAPQKQQLQ
jgi:hypothetical protein